MPGGFPDGSRSIRGSPAAQMASGGPGVRRRAEYRAIRILFTERVSVWRLPRDGTGSASCSRGANQARPGLGPRA